MTSVRVLTDNCPGMETSFGTGRATFMALPGRREVVELRWRLRHCLRADAFRKRLHRKCYLQFLGVLTEQFLMGALSSTTKAICLARLAGRLKWLGERLRINLRPGRRVDGTRSV